MTCSSCGKKKRESVIAYMCEECFEAKLNEFLQEGTVDVGPHAT